MIGGLNSLLPARRLGQPAQEGTSLGLGEARHPELHEGLNTASTILYIVRSAARAIGDISKLPRRRRHAAIGCLIYTRLVAIDKDVSRDATPRNCSEALLATLTTPLRRENAQMHAEGVVHRGWCHVADRCKSQRLHSTAARTTRSLATTRRQHVALDQARRCGPKRPPVRALNG